MKRELSKEDNIAIIVSCSVVLAIIVLAFLFLFYKSANPNSIFFENNTVIRVIDGDTFEYVQILDSSKLILTVRLLCVDTPEVNKSGYEEAKTFLETMILDKQVILIPSDSASDKDAYGRELRYVYVDNIFVNKEILDAKQGELLIIPPEDCEEVR